MKGKIINFYPDRGFGFIKGEDNKKYFFHVSNVINPKNVNINLGVEFKKKKTNKGLSASNIIVSVPYIKKDKFLKIDKLRIRASDIKEYEIITFTDYDNYCRYNYTYYGIKIVTYTSGIKILKFNFFNKNDIDNEYCDDYYGDYEFECKCEQYRNKIKNKSYKKVKRIIEYLDKEMDEFLS